MFSLFFDLIKVSIGNSVCLSHTPSVDEWGKLYALAKKQSLVGVCFAGVQRLVSQQQTPPEMLYLQWMGMAAKIQQRNEVLNRQCAELGERLKVNGYRYAIMKGQGVASLYSINPNLSSINLQNLRQSGDIDLWVDAPKEKVVALAEEMGMTEKPGYLHVGTKFNPSTGSGQVTDVELHYRPTYMRNPWHNKKMQEFCNGFKGTECFKGFKEGNGLLVPSYEFNVVYLLSHIYRHLFGDGIGLRQLMDYYFVLMNTNTSTGFSTGSHELSANCSINSALKQLDLKNIAGAVMYVLKVVFGMEKQYMICEPDEKRGKALLRHIIQTGNFGKMDNEQNMARQSLLGTMIYKIKQWHELLRFYPSEALCAPLWSIRSKLQ